MTCAITDCLDSTVFWDRYIIAHITLLECRQEEENTMRSQLGKSQSVL